MAVKLFSTRQRQVTIRQYLRMQTKAIKTKPGLPFSQASNQPGYPRMSDAPYEKGAPAGITPEKLAQCSTMAREHFNHENSPAEIRAFFVKLESICPKTGFICKSYKLSPQKKLVRTSAIQRWTKSGQPPSIQLIDQDKLSSAWHLHERHQVS